MCLICLLSQKNTVKTLFGGVITNNVVSLVSLKRSMFFTFMFSARLSVTFS